ncbi:MAG: hypothetical protein LQ338_001521 [Usnochroma carphineum]|nr:MAG: hypothetical protein LQ338_001521 [Usnochroma carphineum]
MPVTAYSNPSREDPYPHPCRSLSPIVRHILDPMLDSIFSEKTLNDARMHCRSMLRPLRPYHLPPVALNFQLVFKAVKERQRPEPARLDGPERPANLRCIRDQARPVS